MGDWLAYSTKLFISVPSDMEQAGGTHTMCISQRLLFRMWIPRRSIFVVICEKHVMRRLHATTGQMYNTLRDDVAEIPSGICPDAVMTCESMNR